MPMANAGTASVLMASRRLPNTDLTTPLTSSANGGKGKLHVGNAHDQAVHGAADPRR